MAMIAITTSSSISVNPGREWRERFMTNLHRFGGNKSNRRRVPYQPGAPATGRRSARRWRSGLASWKKRASPRREAERLQRVRPLADPDAQLRRLGPGVARRQVVDRHGVVGG